jgi:5-methylcytosine-specific restriction endonuclease McrA
VKCCSRCEAEKQVGDFYLDKSKRDGFSSRCKECVKADARAWYAEHTERHADRMRARREHVGPGEQRAYDSAWKARDPRRARLLKNSREAKRRAQKRGACDEQVDIATLHAAYGGCCGICQQFVSLDEVTIDHHVPLSKGGRHSYFNTRPAHLGCNVAKGDRMPITIPREGALS